MKSIFNELDSQINKSFDAPLFYTTYDNVLVNIWYLITTETGIKGLEIMKFSIVEEIVNDN